VTGVVAAPPAAVWPVLLTVLPELAGLPPDALIGLDAPRTFTVLLGSPPVATAQVAVDPLRHEVALQGEWWYRGVVAVNAAADGARITRSIHNVAPGWSGWLVPFVHRHDEQAFRTGHEALLRSIASRLACGWSLSPARSRS
jgi:hypothetical protein